MTAFNFEQISMSYDPQSCQAQLKLDLFQCLSDVSSDCTFLASIIHLMLLHMVYGSIQFSTNMIVIQSRQFQSQRTISISLKSNTRLDFFRVNYPLKAA